MERILQEPVKGSKVFENTGLIQICDAYLQVMHLLPHTDAMKRARLAKSPGYHVCDVSNMTYLQIVDHILIGSVVSIAQVQEVLENAAWVKLSELETCVVLVSCGNIVPVHKLVDVRVHQKLILVLKLPLTVVHEIHFSVNPLLLQCVNE